MEEIWKILENINNAIERLLVKYDEADEQHIIKYRKEAEQLLFNKYNLDIQKVTECGEMNNDDWLHNIYRVIEDIENPLNISNCYDFQFSQLMNYIWNNPSKVLKEKILNTLDIWKTNSLDGYNKYVQYYNTFPLWGSFDPENNDYNTIDLRVKCLKQHSYDFLWLYKKLEDYMSKRTLCAILLNWAYLDVNEVAVIKSPFKDYYEPDIFPDNKDDVFVDVGAYIGDSIMDYARSYGGNYKKIYAYEISPQTIPALVKNTAQFHDVNIINKGLGKEEGEMFLNESSDSSANQVSSEVQSGVKVAVTTMDNDIHEPVSFIKMDIEGAETDALLGAVNHIREDKPKLAICTYHGYDDLWRIPFIVDTICPDYKFYMRHYGGNFPPTEFVLLCKVDK